MYGVYGGVGRCGRCQGKGVDMHSAALAYREERGMNSGMESLHGGAGVTGSYLCGGVA